MRRSSEDDGSKAVGMNNVEGVKVQDEYVRVFLM
jgi:hypothetical protein